MVEEITRGISVSVRPLYVGQIQTMHCKYQAFKYQITIRNQSKFTVQLLKRYWEIYDALNDSESVSGTGVVGKTPVIGVNESYTYQSNCYLIGSFGSMKGHYLMYSPLNKDTFKVVIPSFPLQAQPSLN